MAGGRLPGPMCRSKPSWFDGGDGPEALGHATQPGPLGFELPSRLAAEDLTEPNVDFLFFQCPAPAMGLSDADYEDAAARLGVEVAAIKAVAQVETMGNAFDVHGRPTILFERHHFHRHTGGKYDADHPIISNETAGGYGKFSAQYDKLEEAYRLDPEAALKSASWGRFQIMGSNHEACGFPSVTSFVLAMTRAESEHLRAFVNFVESNNKRVKALQDKDWATFAKLYNGAGYKKKGYDVNMKKAYDAIIVAEAATKPPTKP